MSNNGEDNGEDIRKALREIPSGNYPRELYTATRAEYVTNVKKIRKPGCPLFGGAVLLLIIGILNIIF